MNSQPTKRLRIALLCNGYTFEAWEAACIREVMDLPFTEVVLLIAPPEKNETAPGFFQKLKHYSWKHFFWNRLDKKSKQVPARRGENLQETLAHVPLIHCTPEIKGKYSEYFTANDIQRIRDHRPDVILRFAYNIIRGEILTVAPYGVWSFHHADEQQIRGGPGAFWEIQLGYHATGALLQRLTDKLDAGIVLRKGWFPTIQHSYRHNLDQLLWGTVSWMKQVCIDIHHNQAAFFNDKPVQTNAPVYKFPGNFRMLQFVSKLLANKSRFHWNELFRAEQWNVGIINRPLADFLNKVQPEAVNWLPEKTGVSFKADPFGFVDENGATAIFYERYDFKTGKGVIESFAQNTAKTILETEFHLSFPFVFSHEGETYLLPEANESGQLTCYKFSGTEIKPFKTLLPFPVVDSNIVYYKNKWWMFCTREDKGSNYALYIYHSTDIFGTWEAHANNPVKCDVRSARPAGAAFVKEGKLFRPGQQCVPEYGSAVVIHEVQELSETQFREVAIHRLVPNQQWKYNKGLHHISALGDSAVLIDAKYYRFSYSHFIKVLKRKWQRLM